MSRILKAYDESVFEISEHFIKVIFPFSTGKENVSIDKSSGDENGDENGDEIKILNILESEPDSTAQKLSKKTGFSARKISRIIKKLRESGKIIRIGSDRKGYWKINE